MESIRCSPTICLKHCIPGTDVTRIIDLSGKLIYLSWWCSNTHVLIRSDGLIPHKCLYLLEHLMILQKEYENV